MQIIWLLGYDMILQEMGHMCAGPDERGVEKFRKGIGMMYLFFLHWPDWHVKVDSQIIV